MQTKRYQIKCLDCGGTSIIEIWGQDIVHWINTDQVISARKRLDNQWGFQCFCGNNDIMTTQEKRTIDNPANPLPQEVQQIIENIKADAPKFRMEPQ